MKRVTFATLFLGVISLSMVLGMPCAQAADGKRGTKAHIYGDAERGRDIAAKWCRSCHYAQASNANDQIPTFAEIAAGPMGRPDTLRAFLNAPHKPMPPLQLTNQEIEDLVAFISHQK